MSEQAQSASNHPLIISESLRMEIVRSFLREAGRRGGLAGSRLAKSIGSKRAARRRWLNRRKMYGPTGYKPKPGWLRAKYPNSFPQDREESPINPNP